MNIEQVDNSQYFINRELSWLEFNNRVLEEARDKKNPLFERIKFLSIVSSNLDEFFMIRVASLKDQVNALYDKPDPSGLRPKHQLKNISIKTHKMIYNQYNTFNRILLPRLRKNGISIINGDNLSYGQKEYLCEYFNNILYPVLTPMAVDSSRPFPLILNKSLNIATLIKDKGQGEEYIFATVQVPSVLPRMVEFPSAKGESRYFILLEEIIMMFIDKIFLGHKIICAHPYRITRNADLSIEEEEAEDLLIEIVKSLKKRKRGAAIRLEVDCKMDKRLINILKTALEIHDGEIYAVNGPVDLTFLMKLYACKGYEHLKYDNYIPCIPKDLLEEEDIFEAISKKDIFLHLPYESFDPVEEFIKKAAQDPNVLAIKQTLYRVSGDSSIVKTLAEAAEHGKQVMVVVEVKARFDEENNILWAKRLEQAGCHVIYGLVGLKVHCKATLIVRMEENKIKRYVHLGTGNYNDITAKLYTDMGLFTCNDYYAAEISAVFNMLSGYSEPPELYKLEIAPINLRGKLVCLIEKEIDNALQGKKARVIAIMNSLADPEMINVLYRASSAGVKIDLIVRGICCLRPGIPGVSENITVRSIVGRFLEHSRAYFFYNDGQEKVFLSSADWMPRNLDRRIELLFEIEDNSIKGRITEIIYIMLEDTVKARILNSEGNYKKVDRRGKKTFDSQSYFCQIAIENDRKAHQKKTQHSIEPITSGKEF